MVGENTGDEEGSYGIMVGGYDGVAEGRVSLGTGVMRNVGAYDGAGLGSTDGAELGSVDGWYVLGDGVGPAFGGVDG